MYFSTLSQFIMQSNIITGGEEIQLIVYSYHFETNKEEKHNKILIFFKQNLCFLYFTYFTLFYHGKLWWR